MQIIVTVMMVAMVTAIISDYDGNAYDYNNIYYTHSKRFAK